MPRQPRKSQAQVALENQSESIRLTVVRLYRDSDKLKDQAETLMKVRDDINQQIATLYQTKAK
jgi:purine-nucleoside phosphorylase